jgi:hypothetical protein
VLLLFIAIIYVAVIGTRYMQKCGTHACGAGYRDFYNDVWRSKKNCTKLQRKADPIGCSESCAIKCLSKIFWV